MGICLAGFELCTMCAYGQLGW